MDDSQGRDRRLRSSATDGRATASGPGGPPTHRAMAVDRPRSNRSSSRERRQAPRDRLHVALSPKRPQAALHPGRAARVARHRVPGRAVHPAAERVLGEGSRSPATSNRFTWSLNASSDREQRGLPDVAIRTVGMAILVTLTDALLAFPIAYYMARIASPRKRGMLVVAVLMPLWASLPRQGLRLAHRSCPGHGFLDGSSGRSASAAPGLDELSDAWLVLSYLLAALHDPADLRRPRADPELAARGLGGPGRASAARPSERSSCRSSSQPSSPGRSSRSR